MAINFHRVYLMSDLNGVFTPSDQFYVVAGCRILPDEKNVLQFGCCAGTSRGAIFFPTEVLEDHDEILLLKDLLPKAGLSEWVTWKLEPYTLDKWREHGDAGKVPLYEDLKDRLLTTDELQNFLFNELVDDWWVGESQRMGAKT